MQKLSVILPAAVLLVADVADARVVETPDHLLGPVPGAVVNHGELEVLVCLLKHAAYRPAHHMRVIGKRMTETVTITVPPASPLFKSPMRFDG